ncbi:MAG: MarR family winged helix-turn-helix transcriptional regulator [Thermotaleaceae bacterium]
MECEINPIGKWISILYRQSQSYIAGQIKPYHIGSGQYTFLLALYQKDGISQEELSKLLMMDKGTTARAIAKLEKTGYVVRKMDPHDKRAYNLFITDKARAIKPILCQVLSSWINMLIENLEQEEQECIENILKKMVISAIDYNQSTDHNAEL